MKTALITLTIGIIFSLTSCNDKIDVQQEYDFSITTMPVQKRIAHGQTAEIRCQLHRSGHYDNAAFYISYFQPDGKGVLRNDEELTFAPNDIYPLTKETFRLYYTSECSDQQQIDITVYDNFGQRRELSFSFQNEN